MAKHDIETRLAVQKLAREGSSDADICRMLHVSFHFVKRWRDRPDAKRLLGSSSRLKIDSKSRRKMARRAQTKARPGQRKLAQEFGVHHTTVSRHLKRAGLRPRHPQPEPELTEEQKKARVKFAKREKERDFSTVMYEDEKTFVIGHVPNRHNDIIYVSGGEPVPGRPVPKRAAKINVAAGIMIGGRTTLHIFTENMNSAKFQDIINRTLLPGGRKHFRNDDWILMMDRHPTHYSVTSVQHMDQRGINYLPKGEWPANSPDLNPIENVWSMVVSELNKRSIQSRHQMEQALKRIWSKLPQDKIDNAINSIPKRLRAVIRTKGAPYKC